MAALATWCLASLARSRISSWTGPPPLLPTRLPRVGVSSSLWIMSAPRSPSACLKRFATTSEPTLMPSNRPDEATDPKIDIDAKGHLEDLSERFKGLLFQL